MGIISMCEKRVQRETLKNVSSASDATMTPWLALDLHAALLRLSDSLLHDQVRTLYDHPFKNFPDVLMVALASADAESWTALQDDLVGMLMPVFLNPHPNTAPVLIKVWQARRALVLRGMVDWFNSDPSMKHLPRILDIAQDMKALAPLLETNDYVFVLELAVLASFREFLNLEKWLSDRLAQRPLSFAAACLKYLDRRLNTTTNENNPKVSLLIATALERAQEHLPPTMSQAIANMKARLHSKMQLGATALPAAAGQGAGTLLVAGKGPANVLPGVAPTLAPGMAEPSLADPGEQQPIREFSGDIDRRANSYFQKIYTSQANVDDIIGLLHNFKASERREDQEVFHCMIRNLFDEYKFFPQYPTKELGITGELFGALVKHNLVYGRTLSTALRYVLEALKQEPDTKMFSFGITALSHFTARLREWPQYCEHIAHTPHVAHLPEEIQQILKTHRQQASAGHPLHGMDPHDPAVAAAAAAESMNAAPLVDTTLHVPPEAVQVSRRGRHGGKGAVGKPGNPAIVRQQRLPGMVRDDGA